MNHSSRYFAAKLAATAGLVLLASSASATVVSGSSSGYGANVDLSGVLGLQVGPLPNSASGAAPAPYNNSDSVANVEVGTLGLLNLSANAVSGHAQSNIDGLSGDRYTLGESEIVGLAINSPLLTLTADTITSSANISGDYGSIDPVGSSNLANASLSIAGQRIDLDANAAANTAILPGLLNPLGLSLVLNEQTMSDDGNGNASMITNALHLSFNDALLGLGVLNGDIVIGHSQASLSAVTAPGNGGDDEDNGGTPAVPAPGANWLFLVGGLALILIGMKKQKHHYNDNTAVTAERLITS